MWVTYRRGDTDCADEAHVKRHGWPLHPKTDPPLFFCEFEHKNMILMVRCGWRARCARAHHIPRRRAQEKQLLREPAYFALLSQITHR